MVVVPLDIVFERGKLARQREVHLDGLAALDVYAARRARRDRRRRGAPRTELRNGQFAVLQLWCRRRAWQAGGGAELLRDASGAGRSTEATAHRAPPPVDAALALSTRSRRSARVPPRSPPRFAISRDVSQASPYWWSADGEVQARR